MQNMYNNYEAMLGEISKDLSKGEGAWGNFLGRQNCFVSWLWGWLYGVNICPNILNYILKMVASYCMHSIPEGGHCWASRLSFFARTAVWSSAGVLDQSWVSVNERCPASGEGPWKSVDLPCFPYSWRHSFAGWWAQNYVFLLRLLKIHHSHEKRKGILGLSFARYPTNQGTRGPRVPPFLFLGFPSPSAALNIPSCSPRVAIYKVFLLVFAPSSWVSVHSYHLTYHLFPELGPRWVCVLRKATVQHCGLAAGTEIHCGVPWLGGIDFQAAWLVCGTLSWILLIKHFCFINNILIL